MTKFRSKLKKKSGAKKLPRGQTSVSNPETTKHRQKAKSRFFQSNLRITPTNGSSVNGLTMEAVQKHEAIQSFSLRPDPIVNSLSGSLKSFSLYDDGDDVSRRSMSQATSFASNFSACSNMSFNKLINNFRPDLQVHKEMLAILAALTEIIKEKGGSQTSTEYFLALMETIENSKEENDIRAALSLLNMGIKSVPEAVLRKKFSETGQILIDLIARFVDSPDKNFLRNIISCMSVLLRAQEYAQWNNSSTFKFFDAILSFVTHTKPKVRKASQHAITAILFGSCFVIAKQTAADEDDDDDDAEEMKPLPTNVIHPAASRVAKFSLDQFRPENVNNNQTLILHVLGLLQTVLPGFSKDDIKTVSEQLLSVMTSGNMLIRTNCFQTFHSLFTSKSNNLTAQLVGRLVTALYEYRPDRSDFRQILAWLAVMKQAHICLESLNQQVCVQALTKFVDICANDLWLSDKTEVISGTSNSLKEILEDCVKPCCADGENIPELYRAPMKKIISTITKALTAPFGSTSNHVVVICGTMFEALGRSFGAELEESLKILGQRYDDQSVMRVHIEHAVLSAVSSIDTERVLKCIPLTEANGQMSMKRSWILPLLREGLQQSSLEFFSKYIVKLAYQCYTKWQSMKEQDKKSDAHIYELLCCQLWGLFPGFCRNPKDIHNFKLIAKTLGTVLNENPDLRPPVLDGFKELLASLKTDEDKQILGRYAQNYMTRFFNIYTTKPGTSYENEIRLSAYEVALEYLKVTPKPVLNVLFESAIDQLNAKTPGSFMYDMLFDIVESLALFQSSDKVKDLYENYIVKALTKEKVKVETTPEQKDKDQCLRRRLKKAYKLLQDIMKSDNEGCQEFMESELENIEKLLTTTKYKTMDETLALRLSCFNLLLDKQSNISLKHKAVKIALGEAVAGFNNERVAKKGISTDILKTVGKLYEEQEKLTEFIDLIIAGLVGDNILVSNTIFALKFVIQEFTENITIESLKFILDQVLEFVVSNQRNEVNASLHFLIIFVKQLPAALTANHLNIIMKALTLMVPDTKRHCRLTLGFLLKKLCKKFTAEEVIRLVPGTEEVMHKRLKRIKKEMSKAKRNRTAAKGKSNGDNSDSDDEEFDKLDKKSMTIDDILADSDSELDDEPTKKEKPEEKKSRKPKGDTYIRESEDSIVDLADPNAFNKITTSKSSVAIKEEKYKKDSNRGFKKAPDGRLIIEDIEDGDTDSDDEDMKYEDGTKKRIYDEPESDDEAGGPSSKKKFAMNNAYNPGGAGIHRPVAASVKSGYSKSSRVSNATSRAPGSEYKAQKAGGDLKKQGKHEPYVYMSISRNQLNRRKRKSGNSQFKNVGGKSTKGNKGGSKSKKRT